MILPRPHFSGSKKLNVRAFIWDIVGYCTSAGFFRILQKAGDWRLHLFVFCYYCRKNCVLFFRIFPFWGRGGQEGWILRHVYLRYIPHVYLLTYNLLTIASFRIGIPSIVFFWKWLKHLNIQIHLTESSNNQFFWKWLKHLNIQIHLTKSSNTSTTKTSCKLVFLMN